MTIRKMENFHTCELIVNKCGRKKKTWERYPGHYGHLIMSRDGWRMLSGTFSMIEATSGCDLYDHFKVYSERRCGETTKFKVAIWHENQVD
jgi:hypothetical protein